MEEPVKETAFLEQSRFDGVKMDQQVDHVIQSRDLPVSNQVQINGEVFKLKLKPRSVKNPSNAFRPTLSEIDQMEPIDGKKKKRDRFKKKMATKNKKEKKYFDDVKKNFQFFLFKNIKSS